MDRLLNYIRSTERPSLKDVMYIINNKLHDSDELSAIYDYVDEENKPAIFYYISGAINIDQSLFDNLLDNTSILKTTETTILHEYCKRLDAQYYYIKSIIAKINMKISVEDESDIYGNLPIFYYVINNKNNINLDIIEALGPAINFNYTDKEDNNILMVYLNYNGNPSTNAVKFLCNYVSLDNINKNYDTALHIYLINATNLNYDIIKLLVTNQNISIMNRQHLNPLMIFVKKFYNISYNRNIKLLTTDKTVIQQDNDSNTALHIYLLKNSESFNIDIIKLLVKQNNEIINIMNNNSEFPLSILMKKTTFYAVPIVEMLFNKKLNIRNIDGYYPLHMYIMNNIKKECVIDDIVHYKAIMSILQTYDILNSNNNKDNMTPLGLLLKKGISNTRLIRMLLTDENIHISNNGILPIELYYIYGNGKDKTIKLLRSEMPNFGKYKDKPYIYNF